jgi:hypothetical protein
MHTQLSGSTSKNLGLFFAGSGQTDRQERNSESAGLHLGGACAVAPCQRRRLVRVYVADIYMLRSCFDLIACIRSTFGNGCILSRFFDQ